MEMNLRKKSQCEKCTELKEDCMWFFLFLGYFLKSLIVGRVRGLWSDTAVCLEVLHVSFMSSMHMLRYTRLPRITAVSLGERLWSELLNISEVKRQHIRSRAEMNTTYFM